MNKYEEFNSRVEKSEIKTLPIKTNPENQYTFGSRLTSMQIAQ